MQGIDLVATYANALTAGLQGVQRAQLPIVLATDRDAVHAAVLAAGLVDVAQVRLARVRSTLKLSEMMVSPNLLPECQGVFEHVHGSPAGPAFSTDGRISEWFSSGGVAS